MSLRSNIVILYLHPIHHRPGTLFKLIQAKIESEAYVDYEDDLQAAPG
jgi:hypothetical protein